MFTDGGTRCHGDDSYVSSITVCDGKTSGLCPSFRVKQKTVHSYNANTANAACTILDPR